MKTGIKLSRILFVILLFGCNNTGSKGDAAPTISVSIEPLRYIAGQIAGDDFAINVLVPPGSSPETYEPTTVQLRDMANSVAYFSTGLIDFEHHLNHMLTEDMPGVRLVTLDQGIELIREDEHHGGAAPEEKAGSHSHAHGVDPHIWLSLRCVKKMAETIAGELQSLYPDSMKYSLNYEKFAGKIDSLDRELSARMAGRDIGFMIYHPALTYFARDYGLTQIVIEEDGKEPSAEHIRSLVKTARGQAITKLFYQSQFSQSTVRALAEELAIETVPFDPLAPNVVENIDSLSHKIMVTR